MKKRALDLTWLTKSEEWDFRSVTEAECRIACHWEYAREIQLIQATLRPRLVANNAGLIQKAGTAVAEPRSGALRRDVVTRSMLFPKPWVTLTDAERADVFSAVEPLPALQVRGLRDFLARTNWSVNSDAKLLQRFSEGAYVIRPNFSSLGVEVILKEFEKWARREAKNYARSPRAKAAEPPFDLLKWLSVYRLEEQRREARITYEKAQDALREYQRANRMPDPNDVFPMYASHGAWSKARKDAERTRAKVIGDATVLLRDWYALS